MERDYEYTSKRHFEDLLKPQNWVQTQSLQLESLNLKN